MAGVKGMNLSSIGYVQLSDFYGSLRDGDYWSAVKKGISILNGVFNIPQQRGVAAVSLIGEEEEKFNRCLDSIKVWCDSASGRTSQSFDQSEPGTDDDDTEEIKENRENIPLNPKLEVVGAGFGIGEVIAIATMINKLWEVWQKRRNPQTAVTSGQ